MSINVTLRNAGITAVTDAMPSGSTMVVYDGAAPANESAALSGNNVLATLTTTGWAAASEGNRTANAITTVQATGTGTATFVRVLVGGTSVYQVNVGAGVTIDNANIVAGGDVTITSWTMGLPA